MSNPALNYAWSVEILTRDGRANSTAKLVLACIADAINKDSGECWLAQTTIAERTQLTVRSVQNACDRLEELGIISRQKSAWRANLYVYRLPKLDAPSDPRQMEIPDLGGERDSCPKPNELSGGGEPLSIGGESLSIGGESLSIGGESLSPKPKEPKEPINPKRGKRSADAPPLPFSSEAFGEAWNLWLDYRRERRLSIPKPISLRSQFKEFEEWGEEKSISAIHLAIRKNWQGLFEPKQSKAANGSASITNDINDWHS